MNDTIIYDTRKLFMQKYIEVSAKWILELTSDELQELLPFIASYLIVPRDDEDLVIFIAEELMFPTIDIPAFGEVRKSQIDDLHYVISMKIAHDVQVYIMRQRGEMEGSTHA